eukprot:gene6060-1085_t
MGILQLTCGLASLVAARGEWEHIGPRNIFNDATNHGESGTLADAASPAANPQLIYTGGSNNGASSGILKTTNMGRTWIRVALLPSPLPARCHRPTGCQPLSVPASKGLFDTRISSVLVSPDDKHGGHVYAGTASGVYESVDFAATWTFLPATAPFGRVRTLAVGSVGGSLHVLASAAGGVASTPVAAATGPAGKWTLAAWPAGAMTQGGGAQFSTAVNSTGADAALGACVRMNKTDAAFAGEGFIGTYKAATSIEWARPAGETLPPPTYVSPSLPTPWTLYLHTPCGRTPVIPCAKLGLHPTDPQHFIYTNSTWGTPGASVLHNTWGSRDGGATVANLAHPTEAFHCAIDSGGRYYTGAEAGAYVSADGGATWSAFVVNMTAPGGEVMDRIPHDYQGISTGFAGDSVAFPSDQGLFIAPPPSGRPGGGAAVPLINVNGDMSNNIAIKLAVSAGAGDGARYLVTSMWDWGPVASWDSGRSWPIGDWNPHGPDRQNGGVQPAREILGDGGSAISVELETEHGDQDCHHDLSTNFWIPRIALAELGIPSPFPCGKNYT